MPIRSILLTVSLVLLLLGFRSASPQPVKAAGPGPQVNSYHPINPNYWRIKAAIDARAPRGGRTGPFVSGAPASFVSWNGQGPGSASPADSNGAIGPSEYIETVNFTTGVYDRQGHLLSQTDERSWTGFDEVMGDVVVEYSAPDNRFYAVMMTLPGPPYPLVFGFSKTGTPSASASDWCFYESDFGGRYKDLIPDYPKLGDSADFLLIGVNAFDGNWNYLASDVAWVAKPPKRSITVCPGSNSLKLGTIRNIKNADGTLANTPNPAKQVDASHVGAVVANEDLGPIPSSIITAYAVTRDSYGSAVLSRPKGITVMPYEYPPDAPQNGTDRLLDTLGACLNSAWMARDPGHGNQFAVWTGHTVAASTGGLGAEFRWYEIAQTGALYASGIVQRPDRYVFMGAISPDRNGASGQFGDKWLATVNSSSSKMYVLVSAVSANGWTDLHMSNAPDEDYTCSPVCRWGDYSGASPDPAAIGAGQVWGTAMYSRSGSPGWGTWNFGAVP